MVALFVITTFLVFLAIDFLVRRSAPQLSKASAPKALSDRFLIPRSFFFTPRHSWVELLGNGKTRVGIDDFVQKIIGTVDNLSVAPVQAIVKKGEPILTITQGHRKLSFAAPISGKIVEINDALMLSPDILNADPYVRGWIAIIEPANLGKDIKGMTIAEEAAQWLKGEISRFREFMKVRSPQSALAGATMLDGGVPVVGTLRGAADESWEAFEEEFL